METPSQKLAQKITDRLIKEGLIKESTVGNLLPKLAQGTLKAEDWKLPIEVGMEEETDHE